MISARPLISYGGSDLQVGPDQWQDAIRNLRSPDVKVRLTAVEQLGQAGYSAAAEEVAPLVTDPDDRVQFAAIDAELTFFLVESIGARRVGPRRRLTRGRSCAPRLARRLC